MTVPKPVIDRYRRNACPPTASATSSHLISLTLAHDDANLKGKRQATGAGTDPVGPQ
ncbi:hypothetical protein GCM10010174_25700 [Kutzneria viridogrisea]|uniref:Uncharacterized protein n=2 Tax=Kutzneria TaxID=43356 RepID=W5W620_9PSEU|nr:hypothetical protein KALB_2588 [Kutzneria albida DSM 43870]MBA8928843.1 hypothetical protein [Kutzneria viridogrisea]